MSGAQDQPRPSPRHLVLVGGMGVGKSSTGRALADHLDRPLLDSDDHLMATTGRTARELADQGGVADLHEREAGHLLGALAHEDPAVVAAAASVVDDQRCLDALRSPDVVWLRAGPETAVGRMEQGSRRRALGPDRVEAVTALADRRAARYAEIADLVVDTEQLSVADVAQQVLTWLGIRYP